jgi:hypothetical protein
VDKLPGGHVAICPAEKSHGGTVISSVNGGEEAANRDNRRSRAPVHGQDAHATLKHFSRAVMTAITTPIPTLSDVLAVRPAGV